MEHAFAEERAAERDAVKTADEIFTLVDLDAVAVAPLVELAIKQADTGIDPCARAAGAGLGATLEHAVEVAVDGDGETVGAHRAGEPLRHMKAIERNDAALLRLDPVERRIVRAFRHRKDAAGI